MRGVILAFAVLFLFSMPFTFADSYDEERCDDPGYSIGVFRHLGVLRNYCLTDLPCTVDVRRTTGMPNYFPVNIGNMFTAGGHGLQLRTVGPVYDFTSSGCETPGGCIEPYEWGGVDGSYATITIPENTYPSEGSIGLAHFGYVQGCEPIGITHGVQWYYFPPLDSLYIYDNSDNDNVCQTDAPCNIKVEHDFRPFINDIKVFANQGGISWTADSRDLNSGIIISNADYSFDEARFDSPNYMYFTIPANTFGAGTVDIEIFDMLQKFSIAEQETGGFGTITFEEPTTYIRVSPSNCYSNQDCEINIEVVGLTISEDDEFGFYGPAGNFGPLGMNDATVNNNIITYQISANTFSSGSATVQYFHRPTLTTLEDDMAFSASATIPIDITVNPEECILQEDCDVEIILNQPPSFANDDIVFVGAVTDRLLGPFFLTDPQVSVSGSTISFTIPANEFNEPVNAYYYRNLGDNNYDYDYEVINMINELDITVSPSICTRTQNCNLEISNQYYDFNEDFELQLIHETEGISTIPFSSLDILGNSVSYLLAQNYYSSSGNVEVFVRDTTRPLLQDSDSLLMIDPQISTCEYQLTIISHNTNGATCVDENNMLCDQGEQVGNAVYISPVGDCSNVQELVLNFEDSYDGSCVTDGVVLEPFRITGLNGLNTGNLPFTIDQAIPEVCEFKQMLPTSVQAIESDGNSVFSQLNLGYFIFGSNPEISGNDIFASLSGVDCGTSDNPCDNLVDEMSLEVTFPNIYSDYLIQDSFILANINDPYSCNFPLLDSVFDDFTCNEDLINSKYVCNSIEQLPPSLSPECYNAEVSLNEITLYKHDVPIIESSNTEGSILLDGPSGNCELLNFEVDVSDCDSGVEGNFCWTGEEVKFTAEIIGYGCSQVEEILLREIPITEYLDGQVSCDLSTLGGLSLSRVSITGQTHAFEGVLSMPVMDDDAEYFACFGNRLAIDSLEGFSSSGSLIMGNVTEGYFDIHAGPCRQFEEIDRVNSLSDLFRSYDSAHFTPGASEILSTRRDFGYNDILPFSYSGFSFGDYSKNCDSLYDERCNPGEYLSVLLYAIGDCSEIEAVKFNFDYMDDSSPYPQYSEPADLGTGSAQECFTDDGLILRSNDDLYSINDLNNKTGIANLNYKIKWVPDGNGVANCLNEAIWPTSVELLNADSSVNNTWIIEHNSLASQVYPLANPGFFRFGDISGFETFRFCGEVRGEPDSYGVFPVLREKSCFNYDPPIDTVTSTEYSGKCSSETDCLWVYGPGNYPMPDYDGAPRPPANDYDFWSNVNCYEEGSTINHFMFDDASGTHYPVTLVCMGRQQWQNSSGDLLDVNPWCPDYGTEEPLWEPPNLYDSNLNGYCRPAHEVCDVGTNSSMSIFYNLNDEAMEQLECDVPISQIMQDNSSGGLMEKCLVSYSGYVEGLNDPLEFPKVRACCPEIKIPVQTNDGNNQLFYFYDNSETIKIY